MIGGTARYRDAWQCHALAHPVWGPLSVLARKWSMLFPKWDARQA
jgi:hypothetical protein